MIHFYLVQEAEMVIVFMGRDLEQNHAFADKAFQEANESTREKKCMEGSFKKDQFTRINLGWVGFSSFGFEQRYAGDMSSAM